MGTAPHGRHTGAPLQTPVVIALTRKQRIDRRLQALNLKWQIIPYREGLDVSAVNWRRKTRMASRRLLCWNETKCNATTPLSQKTSAD